MTQRRPSGLGAYTAELKQIRLWTHENQRPWFTPADVSLSENVDPATTDASIMRLHIENMEIHSMYDYPSSYTTYPAHHQNIKKFSLSHYNYNLK